MIWHYMSLAGLTLIAFGWFYQFGLLSNKGREISPMLPLANAVGIALLTLDAFGSGMIDIAMFNGLTLIGACLVFITIYSPAAMLVTLKPEAKAAKKGKRKK